MGVLKKIFDIFKEKDIQEKIEPEEEVDTEIEDDEIEELDLNEEVKETKSPKENKDDKVLNQKPLKKNDVKIEKEKENETNSNKEKKQDVPKEKSKCENKQVIALNEYQKEAVLNDDNACIVSANVGSGKTTVLISKVLYLSQKYNIKDLIILTFTNKAAQEIKERLMRENSNLKSNDLLYCGTFHSVALELLKEELPVTDLGYTTDFSVIDPEEEFDIANELIFDNQLNIKYKNRLHKRLENEKSDYLHNKENKYGDDIFKLFDLLKIEKQKQNKMDFDDLIYNTIVLLKKNKIHPKWIIVDEFQDSSSELLEFIDALKDDKTKLFVVGDENQIIYSWRNTNKDVFKNFKEKYKATTLSLPINYRSTKSILEVAKSVLKKPIDLIGTRELENKIVIKKHYNAFNEAQYLSEEIKKIIKLDNNTYGDIAILYRTQKQSTILADVFDKEKIPYEISYRKTLNSIPVLCWLVSLLRSSINHADNMSIIKVCTDTMYGLNITKIQVKKMLANEIEKSDFIKKIYNFNVQNFKTIYEIYDYYNLDSNIKPTSASYESDKNLIMIFLEKINNLILEKKLTIKEGISEFVNSSTLYGINILNENINLEKNCVKLMTLHASKGLEFKYVYIIGANDGLIPISQSNMDEYEEEQRLFYVGITRAKDFLEISYYTNPDEPRVFDSPSEFLEDIPNNLVETEDREALKTNSLATLKKQISESDDLESGSLKELFGDNSSVKKIKHPKYGIGKVIEETDDIIVIDFEKYGKKEFLKELEVYEIL